MNFKRFIQSFRDAAKGIRYTFSRGQNFRVQIAVGTVIVISMFFLSLSRYEVIILCLMITLVLLLELLNTAVEKMLDLLKPRMSLHVETVKHVMAATVLLASCAAVIIGAVILLPPVIELFGF